MTLQLICLRAGSPSHWGHYRVPGPRESPSTHKGTLVPREQSPSPTRGPMHPAKEALSSSELKAVAISLLMLCSKSTVFPLCLFCLGSRSEYFFFYPWLPNLVFSILHRAAHQGLLKRFCIQIQKKSLRRIPMVLLWGWHFLQAFCQEAGKWQLPRWLLEGGQENETQQLTLISETRSLHSTCLSSPTFCLWETQWTTQH